MKITKEQFNDVQIDIIKYLLMQKKTLTTQHMIINSEKLRKKYDEVVLVGACLALSEKRIIKFTGSNGSISSLYFLKKLESIFWFTKIKRIIINIVNIKLIKILSYIWNNIVVKIIILLIVAYLILKLNIK